MKECWFFFLEKLNVNVFAVRKPNTLIAFGILSMIATGLLPLRAHPRATVGMRPKVASSSVPTINPFAL